MEIVRFKDRLAGKAQASGYGDLLINLRMPGGHVAELRLQVEAMQRIDNYEHVLYEIIRDLENRADEAGRPLTGQERLWLTTSFVSPISSTRTHSTKASDERTPLLLRVLWPAAQDRTDRWWRSPRLQAQRFIPDESR